MSQYFNLQSCKIKNYYMDKKFRCRKEVIKKFLHFLPEKIKPNG